MATPLFGFSQDWRKMDPKMQAFLKLVAFAAVPAFVLLMLDITGSLALGWLAVVAVYLMFKVLGWAIREDRKERQGRTFEKSFLDELRDIDAKVMESMQTARRPRQKPRENKPRFKSAQGEWMTCIMGCGRYTNEGGRFCDDCDS